MKPATTFQASSLSVLAFAAALGATATLPERAAACGGLFCNTAAPVNQTAERILFVDNGNGTMTAAIQIMYQGPSEKFAWVLPIGDIANPDEDIRVSSDLALERLQQATNPLYRLNVSVEGTCKDPPLFGGGGFGGVGGSGGAGGGFQDGGIGGGVIVEASGTVGPFDFELISVDSAATDKAQVAIDWLATNGYDLGIGDDVLRPYLESNLKLLCVRLTKGNDSGSIRPLMITYSGTKPSIPIRPTAAAAQDDMGILVFVGGANRAIPSNYAMLELNDARINWFNPSATYNDVVVLAADEAQGQGFVTEYANRSSTLAGTIVPSWEREQWTAFQSRTFASDAEIVDASFPWAQWDGFRDAFQAAATLPPSVSVDDIMNCPNCYLDAAAAANGVTFDRARFLTSLYELVVRPMFETQDLLASSAYVTRLYTTMSAAEMTVDPSFDFNADLGDVDNNHVAQQIIMCSPTISQFEAPFRVELPSGETVYGAVQGQWPVNLTNTKLPATIRISQAGTSGAPVVLVDNAELITAELIASGAKPAIGNGGTGGSGGTAGAAGTAGASGSSSRKRDSGLCSIGNVGHSTAGNAAWLGLLAATTWLVTRRRRQDPVSHHS